jgi:hypothetical protein
MMGGPGVYLLAIGGSLMVVGFLLCSIYHIFRSQKGRKIEAIFFDCLIGLVVWILAFAISAEVAMKQDDSDLFERVFSFATPFLMFLLSIYFSRKRW